MKCSLCGAQLLRDGEGAYAHLAFGGKCDNAAVKVHLLVDDKGFVKLEKL